MDATTRTRLRREAVAVAIRAGAAILEVYHGPEAEVDATRKADDSPLTRADLAAHRVLTRELGELAPRLPVLSEEGVNEVGDERRGWERYWLVDPLDGTKEFLKRNGEFTVNVALVEGERPVLGVVHVPVTGVTYSAAQGEGAFRAEPGEDERPIAVRRPGEAAMTVVASRSHRDAATDALLDALGERRELTVVSKGSSLKICEVAEGRAHLYPRTGPTMEWDTAAAQAVLEQAGGALLRLDAERWGEPLRYNRDDMLNPGFVAGYDASVLELPGMDRVKAGSR